MTEFRGGGAPAGVPRAAPDRGGPLIASPPGDEGSYPDACEPSAVLEGVPAISYVCVADISGRTLYMSPQCREMTGYSMEDFVDDPELEDKIIDPDDYERVMRAWARACAVGHPFACEYRLRTRDGSVRWFRDEARFVRDSRGRPVAAQGVMMDITDSKDAEQQIAAQRDHAAGLLDSLGGVVIGADLEGRVTYCNRAFEQATGYGLADVKGLIFWELLVPPEEVDDIKELFLGAKAGSMPSQHAHHWITRNGDLRLFRWSLTPIVEDDVAVGIVVLGLDVVDQERLPASVADLALQRASVPVDGVNAGVPSRAHGGTAKAARNGNSPGVESDAGPALEPARPARGDGEKVLVVEDEDGVRRLVERILERNGYQVMVADPDEALAMGADPTIAIDLLITDVIMPSISGRELADRLVRQRPECPVLLMCGYPDEVIVRHSGFAAEVAFIRKPFTAHELLRVTRDVLDSVSA